MKASMKKSISLLLALVTVLSLCPVSGFAAESPAAVPEAPAETGAPASPLPTEEAVQEEPAAILSADAVSALADGVAENLPAIPWADGDSEPSYTVTYYDPTGTTVIATETVSSGYNPDALVGPYHDGKLIVSWTTGQHDWSDDALWLKTEFLNDLVLPMYETVTGPTSFYAVYAPEIEGLVSAPFYLSDSYLGGSGDKFCLVDWLALDLSEGSKLDSSDVPAYLCFNVLDEDNEIQPLYMTFSWYTNAQLSGDPVKPGDVTLSADTVFYGSIPGSYWFVSFRDAEGEALETYALEDGGTLAAYPGDDKTLPTGAYWQDAEGNVYSLDELKTLEIEKDLSLKPFAGYTVNYYYAGTTQLIDSETVLPGGKPAEVPVANPKGTDDRYKAYDYTYEHTWYATTEATGSPVNVKEQVINADTNFYAEDDIFLVNFYDEDGGYLHFEEVVKGAKVDLTGCLWDDTDSASYHPAGWEDEDGNPVDIYNLTITENLNLYAVEGIKVHYYVGTKAIDHEMVTSGGKPQYVPTYYYPNANAETAPITGWVDEDGKTVDPTTVTITAETSFYAARENTVNYYDTFSEDLLGTETVVSGAALAKVPLYEEKTYHTNTGAELDNSVPYVWYDDKSEAEDFLFNSVAGTPLDMSTATVMADTDFYGVLDGGSIQFNSSFHEDGQNAAISPMPIYAGQKIASLPEARKGFSTARWVDEDGDPVDVLSYVSDGTSLELYAVDGIKVSYYVGSTKIAGELVPSGEKPLLVPVNQIVPGSTATEPNKLISIAGWVDEDGREVDPAAVTITEETSFYASLECTVTYLDADGTTVLATEDVPVGQAPTGAPAKNGSNKAITNWLDANGKFVVLESLKVTDNIRLTAWYSPGLNSTEHIKYINGFGSGIFSPQDALTRAQAANIIYSLLPAGTGKGPYTASFTDVPSTKWYYDAVTTLASHKILEGYTDGSFKPNNSITRAEFVTILSRLFAMTAESCSFTDVADSKWYYNAVAIAVDNGWVTGYLNSDTTTYSFRPNNSITRAEAVTIVNRVLGRTADKAAIDATERMIYRDVSPTHWAFYHIMEASVAHEHSISGGVETWGDFTLEDTGLNPGLRNPANGDMYYVDDDGLILRLDAGLNTLPNGNTYYAPKDGCNIPKRTAGIYDLGGKLYYVQNNYAIRTTRYMTGYETPVYEYNGNMYYVKEDYSLARNETIGYLYFGSNGAYTTGDAELDGYVYDRIDEIINSTMTQREKLEAAYYILVDYTHFKYFAYHNPAVGITDWSLEACALRMFKSEKGECYHWAAMMVMLMRRLGYDAYRENGTIWKGTRGHAWEVIVFPDGTKKMFDVEMQWGYKWGEYGSNWHYNCYMMPYSTYPGKPWDPYSWN